MADLDWLARQGWSAADLEANRDGRLSPAQADALRARMRSYVVRTLAWTGPIALAISVAGIVVAIGQHASGFYALPIIAVLMMSPLVLFVGLRARGVRADVTAGRVSIAAGEVSAMFVNRQTGQARVRIGEDRMECFGPGSDRRWQETRRFLGTHDQVRAYYLPGSRLVVAAEPAETVTPTSA
jgi:hypothetical protein